MKRLLPDIYWDPSGKKGIIDTGKTVEFWLKQHECNLESQLSDPDLFRAIMRHYSKHSHSKKPINFKGYHHYVTIEPGEFSNVALVYLYMDATAYGTLFHGFNHKKKVTVNNPITDKKMVKHKLGQAPHNSRTHIKLIKGLDKIKPGRIIKVQTKPELNLKVIFPYGMYKYNENDKIVIDYLSQKDSRFDNLVIED